MTPRHRGERRGPLPFLGLVVCSMLLAAVAAAAGSLVVVPRITGATPLTVLTGSMQPTYPPGSVVVVRPTPADRLGIGDVITYQLRPGDPGLVTHRIVSVRATGGGERQFITRGDANGAPDPAPVTAGQVRGRVWYAVPLAGYLATAVSERHKELVRVVLAAGLLGYAGLLLAGGYRDRRRSATTRPA